MCALKPRFPAMLLALALVLATVIVSAPVRADAEEPAETYVPDQVIVQLTSSTALPGVVQSYTLDPTPLDQFGTRPIYLLRILDGTLAPEKAAALQADGQSRVVFAEPNYVAQAPEGRQKTSWAIGGDAGTYVEQWAPDLIRLPEAQATLGVGGRGSGLVIAVVDTGVDPTHPALAGRLVDGYDFVDDDADPREQGVYRPDDPANTAYGHGTHVAGLLALTAPDARIMPVRVLEPDGSGNIWVLAEALRYTVDRGAQVINLSLSTRRPTQLLETLIGEITCSDDDDGSGEDDDRDTDDRDADDRDADDDTECVAASGRGVVVVAAAGNSGGTLPEYPAAEGVPGLLAVAASTPADTLAAFATRGDWVDVAAPGEAIVSSVPGGGYGAWSGSSMAAPFVAGQAALLRSACPTLRATAIAERIVATSRAIDAGTPGRIDVAASVQTLCPRRMLPVTLRDAAR